MNTKSVLMALVMACLLPSNSSKAEEESRATQKASGRATARTLLEEGDKNGKLPEGVVLRVHADLGGVSTEDREDAKARGVEIPESFEEIWEFTSTEVHRLEYVVNEKRRAHYRRIESRPFDSKTLCQQLIDGKLLEIGTGKAVGELRQFVGTPYCTGGRFIEFYRTGSPNPLVDLSEHCTGAGYHESDAVAFAELYETLARQGRAAFAPQPDKPQ